MGGTAGDLECPSRHIDLMESSSSRTVDNECYASQWHDIGPCHRFLVIINNCEINLKTACRQHVNVRSAVNMAD